MSTDNLSSNDPPSELHVFTSKSIDRWTNTFSDNLLRRAHACKISRGSQVLADSDVEDAYWQICGSTNASRVARLLGDASIGAGGILIGLVTNMIGQDQKGIATVLGITGLFLWAVGGYVREWLCVR